MTNVSTRHFSSGDLQRLISWAALAQPQFLGGQIENRTGREVPESVRGFLNNSANYLAVCSNDPECHGEFKRRTGMPLSGPVAAIDKSTGHFFIDPALRHVNSVMDTVRDLSRAYGTPAPMHA